MSYEDTMKTQIPLYCASVAASICTTSAFAKEAELQDMSDPLAVYTQGGVGITDKGFNIKIGQSYDTGSASTMAMNVIEIKGIAGETLGVRDDDEAKYQSVDDSIDSFRLRNFKVDLNDGRGSQLDISYNKDKDTFTGSYSLIQALPRMGPLNFYPLAGVGLDVMNSESSAYQGPDAGSGYTFPGTFAVVGVYSKLKVTDKIWLNYNPMYMVTLSGATWYKDGIYAGDRDILAHEFAASYQISPRSNIRYFANWSDKVNFGSGDHRIEYNYQF
ncbi:hypothetical protein L3Q72_09825 [Vibrio sp. JC009]|uniref:hypothetical protein n=1 Tax=Vibrio sp. JC009 TaxID=2912314 RepID=UPI0023B1A892|nr:hypothetical protein [Vibrio sp. JC009]WED20937.1 hypothetical protein L3Q72_09825 [Vibrio sp. JC009]